MQRSLGIYSAEYGAIRLASLVPVNSIPANFPDRSRLEVQEQDDNPIPVSLLSFESIGCQFQARKPPCFQPVTKPCDPQKHRNAFGLGSICFCPELRIDPGSARVQNRARLRHPVHRTEKGSSEERIFVVLWSVEIVKGGQAET